MTEFLNSVDLSDDIECLCKLLLEYLKFFAAVGINPKEYLDNEINEKASEYQEGRGSK